MSSVHVPGLRLVTAAVLVAVAAGCAAPTGERVAAPPTATQPAAAHPAPTPAATAVPEGRKGADAELRRAVRALRTAQTGRASTTVVYSIPGDDRTRWTRGSYDLEAGLWEYHVSELETSWVSANLIGTDDGRRWVRRDDAEEKPKSPTRWMDLETVGTSADLALLPVLREVDAISIKPRPNGGYEIAGRIPAADAMSLLRLGRQLAARKVTLLAIQGSAGVTIRTDPDGSLAYLEVDGADVHLQVPDGVPAAIRKRMKATYVEVSYGVGGPVDIRLPENAPPLGGVAV